MKLQDYALPREIPTETKEMLDEIRRIINNGGYVPQALSAIPAWYGEDGEWVYYVLGNEQRNYYFNTINGVWNYGIPISSKYSWAYIPVTTGAASAVGTLNFGYTFNVPPLVLVSYIGFTAGTPTAPEDFTNARTKIVVSSFAVTTTGCTLTVYTGDGSNFAANENQGISWLAIG